MLQGAPPPLQGRIIVCFGLCFQGVGQVQKGWGSLSSWGGWGGSLDRLARIFLCWGGLPRVTITAISLLWHWLSLPNVCLVPGTLGISQPFLRSITAISQKWYFQNRIAKEMPLEREGWTWPGTPFGHRQIWDLNSVLIDFQVSAILVECLSFFWSRGLALQRVGHFTHLAMTPVRIDSVTLSDPHWSRHPQDESLLCFIFIHLMCPSPLGIISLTWDLRLSRTLSLRYILTNEFDFAN